MSTIAQAFKSGIKKEFKKWKTRKLVGELNGVKIFSDPKVPETEWWAETYFGRLRFFVSEKNGKKQFKEIEKAI